MKLLSLDQSTVRTGWAFIDGVTLMASGVIAVSSKKTEKKTTEQKIFEMAKEVRRLIKLYKPDVVVYEDIAVRKNIQVAMTLGRLQGAIIYICEESKVLYDCIAPTTWRRLLNFTQGAGIKDSDLKKQAISYCGDMFDVTCKADEAEGICIGVAYLRQGVLAERAAEEASKAKAEYEELLAEREAEREAKEAERLKLAAAREEKRNQRRREHFLESWSDTMAYRNRTIGKKMK